MNEYEKALNYYNDSTGHQMTGMGTFTNSGTIEKINYQNPTTFSTHFINNGHMNVQMGDLNLLGGSIHNPGTISIQAGSVSFSRVTEINAGSGIEVP